MANTKEKVYSLSINGKVYKCAACGNIHFDFKNLSFSFSKEEFNQFRNYFLSLNEEYWAELNEHVGSDKPIRVPIHHKNLLLSFSVEEIKEIKALFAAKREKRIAQPILRNSTIFADLCYN